MIGFGLKWKFMTISWNRNPLIKPRMIVWANILKWFLSLTSAQCIEYRARNELKPQNNSVVSWTKWLRMVMIWLFPANRKIEDATQFTLIMLRYIQTMNYELTTDLLKVYCQLPKWRSLDTKLCNWKFEPCAKCTRSLHFNYGLNCWKCE